MNKIKDTLNRIGWKVDDLLYRHEWLMCVTYTLMNVLFFLICVAIGACFGAMLANTLIP